MKVRSKKSIQNATMIFTDREEPRKSFWKKYHAFANDDTIQVLSYYGIGGIGKTSLLKKLIQEMDEKLYKPYRVYYDFKYGQQCHQVLSVIKDRLASSYNFTFPLFELGLYSYCNKVGIKADSIEVKKLTEQSPTLDLLLDIVGNIPMVGMATTIFSLADKSAAFLLTQLKNHKKELLEIEYMDAEDLYKHLPYLFSQDLSNNLEKVTMPLVVFLDTYESLVNELHSMGEPLLNDTWIRSETGIIQNTSNVLWVIAGREKLKWNLFDEGWNDSLEQHILGNLSQNDTDWFFKQSGIVDANLRTELYALTNGVPIYLDLCVERYRSLVEMNAVVTIDKFGSNTFELVERFVRYMSDSQKDLIYTLACLGSWTDELILKVAEKALTSFSMVTYERCMEFSFVQQDENGVYKLHDTMKEILFACCPKMIKESVAKCAFDYYEALYMDENTNRESKMLAMKRVLVFADMIFDEQQWVSYLEDSYIEELSSSLHLEYSTNSNDIYHFLFSLIDRYASDKLRFVIYDSFSDYLLFIGEFEQAIDIAKEVVALGEQLYGETSTITVSKLHDLFILLYKTTHYEEAMKCLEKLDLIIQNDEEQYKDLVNEILVSIAAFHQLIGNYEEAIRCNMNMLKRIGEYSDEHKIVIMTNLANAYSNVKRYEEALPISMSSFQMCLKIYGEDHAITINAAEILAVILFNLKDHEQAIQLQQMIYHKRKEILGELHLETILALNNLASDYLLMGKAEESLTILEDAYHSAKDLYAKEHRIMLSLMSNLASAYFICRKQMLGIALMKEVVKIKIEYLGMNHPDTVESQELLETMNQIVNKDIKIHEE